ncbi:MULTISPECIES: hypothetical protein [Paenibacillus]|uniref:Uncharacterized protein n=1 Tax=Paenibacillus odorifer TaxID=189426 RepID=A0A1R0X321_9BACL|nr:MULTISPECIES: hypothetical protein [Paenibacillus]ETT61185.1 hypothetical protein C171_13095 [Paenibacillus sp. FSL H8-237]MEC0134732.1 hypothetical protein [Paenibacillus odorifer]MEC0221911.1 hypothetical protein [Paenibacillus odorifer]OMD26470.1 hypothetical protein BJP48_22830 [Paenibacillus odorifer]OMD27676.1 hypothetical protein BJP51_24480 [Paenibacillus odorifer]
MRKKLVILVVFCLVYNILSLSVSAHSNLPKTITSGKWAVKVNTSMLPSPEPSKYKSYKLTATNLSKEKLDATFEFYRSVEKESKEKIILIDPTSFPVKSNETIEFTRFFIDKNAKEFEVLISWLDQNKRKHLECMNIDLK